IAVAATTYMVASVWDGIANLIAGILLDRNQDKFRYGPLLVVGAIPLGLSFGLAYFPPVAKGGWAVATVFVSHLLFRTAYAGVNATFTSLTRNGAFVALNAAMMAVIVAMTVLSKSVLYYFKYVLEVPHAGEVALAWMGLAGGIAIPLWMLLGRFVGLRALWLI